MKTKYGLTLMLAIVLTATLAVPAPGGELQKKLVQESTVAQAVKRGSLKVGLDIFVPWAMKDKKGNLVGFEVDVARELAKDMGLEVELVPTKWDGCTVNRQIRRDHRGNGHHAQAGPAGEFYRPLRVFGDGHRGAQDQGARLCIAGGLQSA